ncbi:hypothetical protein [Halogeometricum borinquense]|uniref:hypothetical protein n=1 Tax=Halogeometricum borinquense TaxID=60847 RepID=UPI001376045F|nr:hypothetical protein [Halogeometricum borinquense]
MSTSERRFGRETGHRERPRERLWDATPRGVPMWESDEGMSLGMRREDPRKVG